MRRVNWRSPNAPRVVAAIWPLTVLGRRTDDDFGRHSGELADDRAFVGIGDEGGGSGGPLFECGEVLVLPGQRSGA